jgi:hypothetical protein
MNRIVKITKNHKIINTNRKTIVIDLRGIKFKITEISLKKIDVFNLDLNEKITNRRC